MALSHNALCLMDGTGIGLKDELGLSGTSEDTRLERLIESVSRYIARWCRVPSFHYEEDREDTMRGYGYPAIYVPKTPLISIGSVVYDPDDSAETVDSSEYFVDNGDAGRIYRENGWLWTVAYGEQIVGHPLPGTEQTLYKVTYECGYKTRNQVDNLSVSGDMTLPQDIEDAAIQLCAMRYRWKARQIGVQSERLGDWSVQYVNAGTEAFPRPAMPPEIREMLAPFRRVVFA